MAKFIIQIIDPNTGKEVELIERMYQLFDEFDCIIHEPVKKPKVHISYAKILKEKVNK